MDLCCTVFRSPALVSHVLLPRQEAVYALLKTVSLSHPIEHLIAGPVLSQLEHVKSSAYELLKALLHHHWIVNDAVLTTRLIAWLLDRQADPTLAGLHYKYGIIQMLARDWVESHSDEDLKARLGNYLQQGVVFESSALFIATESRH